MRKLCGERGAAAVEFALVLPILIVLVLGIVEFGRAFQVQSTLAAAAREGVRTMAIEDDAAAARAAARAASASLDPALTDANIQVSPASCAAGAGNATVTITYRQPFFTSFFGTGVDLTGEGVMRCHG